MAITTARLLDLTRLVSRAGRAFTGIDRVEYAYLSRLLSEGPLWGLVRTQMGYLLLNRSGCAALKALLEGGAFPAPDLLSRLRRRDSRRAGAETALRRVAVARCLPSGLRRMLRALPEGCTYLNVGHTLFSVDALRDLRVVVLLHDTIPLDHPEFTRDGMTERFTGFLDRVGQSAALVICNSAQTKADLARHLASPPPNVVAHLGVDVARPGQMPSGPWVGAPYFVALGTIEPRKNHALLLNLWQRRASRSNVSPPHLLICGARGWGNAEVFARLDAGIAGVHELPGLPDHAVAALLQGSTGLLFPSLAEGYGLPPMEAAALGVPVLAADLPVLREVMGDIPIYAAVADTYRWAREIDRLAADRQAGCHEKGSTRAAFYPPTWDEHFKFVLTLI
ncbi:glycosyltransferase family 4 protein [Citreicella sp. C3M06]|uniref:glycosyltransferase family 4 protein n=1 Tax=Citreicella sp. C3M06 TaxID=2841564 RepID=UPI001C0979B8|nr:glycosyltransferase family 1 protein [Citreicella sp. C3M06]MBU2959690.1 glycosyltransferase family 4 protein [Citreicella sp. C3M06]